MYVGDFRASVPKCKDLKINIKTSKILVILLILFVRVFGSFGLFTLFHHTTKFSSLATAVLFSYQSQSSRGGLWKNCSYKFHRIHGKTSVSQSLF